MVKLLSEFSSGIEEKKKERQANVWVEEEARKYDVLKYSFRA
jgi:hypothetical protein